MNFMNFMYLMFVFLTRDCHMYIFARTRTSSKTVQSMCVHYGHTLHTLCWEENVIPPIDMSSLVFTWIVKLISIIRKQNSLFSYHQRHISGTWDLLDVFAFQFNLMLRSLLILYIILIVNFTCICYVIVNFMLCYMLCFTIFLKTRNTSICQFLWYSISFTFKDVKLFWTETP